MPVRPATAETKAFLKRQFGGGSILFGQKRPSLSKQNSVQEPASSEKEDPAVSLQRAIEQRFGVQSTTGDPQESQLSPAFKKALEKVKLELQKPTTAQESQERMNRVYGTPKEGLTATPRY